MTREEYEELSNYACSNDLKDLNAILIRMYKPPKVCALLKVEKHEKIDRRDSSSSSGISD